MRILCAVCKKDCDEVVTESHCFDQYYTFHVRCHGEEDSCTFDPSTWLIDPNARIIEAVAFKTKKLEQQPGKSEGKSERRSII